MSSSSIRPLKLCFEEVLGTLDSTVVIYMKTKSRTPSKNQSSRRPPHHKKCTRTANCFIGRHPVTGSTFIRDLYVFSRTIRRRLAEGHLGSRCPLRVLPLTPTHRHLVWSCAALQKTRLQWNGAKSSLATNPNSIAVVMKIVFVWRDPW
ncbi:uncharacterized protein TNCV_4894461 [Trichonephila clavipes]|nr:uncharacterized protein TNCV_4894461 [Trichonephila clavipes]